MSVKIGSDGLGARTSRDYIKRKKLTPPADQSTTATDTEDVSQSNSTKREFLTQRDIRRKQSRKRRAEIKGLLRESKEKQESDQ